MESLDPDPEPQGRLLEKFFSYAIESNGPSAFILIRAPTIESNDFCFVDICRITKLSEGEISRLSNVVGVEWDSLAGLMDIPYSKREEIRFNNTVYLDPPLKAEEILKLYNRSEGFSRDDLAEHFDELERNDWKKMLRLPVNEEVRVD